MEFYPGEPYGNPTPLELPYQTWLPPSGVDFVQPLLGTGTNCVLSQLVNQSLKVAEAIHGRKQEYDISVEELRYMTSVTTNLDPLLVKYRYAARACVLWTFAALLSMQLEGNVKKYILDTLSIHCAEMQTLMDEGPVPQPPKDTMQNWMSEIRQLFNL